MNYINDPTLDCSAARLCIGTAQFGRKYGINNTLGAVEIKTAKEILKHARAKGVSFLDTAISYECSESTLGEAGVASWSVVTKLPKLPQNISNIDDWVASQVTTSLRNLKLPSIYGLLLHHPYDLLGVNGGVLYRAIERLKDVGLVSKIGISIYDPAEILSIFSKYKFDLLQAPLNIFDRRILSTGWAARLKDVGIEIHARSIFLQGLLLMKPENRPSYFNQWKVDFLRYENWLVDNNISALSSCVKFALSQGEIDKVIVGVESTGQLREIFNCIDDKPINSFIEVPDIDVGLVNPAVWKLK